jgi:hypothetical protein
VFIHASKSEHPNIGLPYLTETEENLASPEMCGYRELLLLISIPTTF